MADWNTWKDRVMDLTRTGVGKAKQLGEIAKLNLDNLSEEEKIKKAYVEIGQKYYELNKDAPEVEYAEWFNQIVTAQTNIAANKDKIADLKKEGDITEEEMQELALEEVTQQPE